MPQAQLDDTMNNISHDSALQYHIERAGDDKSLWQALLSNVLMQLTKELATAGKHRVTAMNLRGAENMVKSFNKNEFEQWKVGVRNSVERNDSDWIGLIAHRTPHPPLISFQHEPSCAAQQSCKSSLHYHILLSRVTIDQYLGTPRFKVRDFYYLQPIILSELHICRERSFYCL